MKITNRPFQGFAVLRLVAVVIACQLASGALAVSFASSIYPEDQEVAQGTGTTIQYFLNEPADSVTIELSDGVTTAATFAGTTDQGANAVIWNGHTDNASGPIAPAGTWNIYITAQKTREQWEEIASHRSLAGKGPEAIYSQVPAGFVPNDCVAQSAQNNSYFGWILANYSDGSTSTYGGYWFAPDLTMLSYPNSLLFEPPSQVNGDSGYEGMAIDPAVPNDIYFTGLSIVDNPLATEYDFMGGELNAPTIVSERNGSKLGADAPRSVVIRHEPTGKYAYTCGLNSTVRKSLFHPMELASLTSSSVLIQLDPAETFLKGLAFDAEGNLYVVSRWADGTDGSGGAIYRWDRELIEVDPGSNFTPLTTASASWKITMPDNIVNIAGPAITPGGDVYFSSVSGSDLSKHAGIYFAGNTAEPSVFRTASVADRVVDFKQIGAPATAWEGSPRYFNLTTDATGNLLAVDRNTEQIRIFAPPGAATRVTRSSDLASITVPAGVSEWNLY